MGRFVDRIAATVRFTQFTSYQFTEMEHEGQEEQLYSNRTLSSLLGGEPRPALRQHAAAAAPADGGKVDEQGEARPNGNTASQSAGLTLRVHYVGVAFHEMSLPDVQELFSCPGLEWVPMEHGAHQYRTCHRRGNVSIFSDGTTPEMGIYVEVTGEGCHQLEGEGVVSDWRAFISLVLNCGGKHSRLDTALDDHEGKLNLDTIRAAIDAGELVCRSRMKDNPTVPRWSDTSSAPVKPGVSPGRTIALGKRGSNTYVRFYDKAAEEGVEGHHIRCELELRNGRAQAMAKALVEQGPEVVAGVLRSFVEFKEPGENQQKCRWKPATWWDDFLEGAAKCRLVVEPAIRTIEKVAAWIDRQCGPALALLRAAKGYGQEWLDAKTDRGAVRMRSHHRAMLLASHGMAPAGVT